MMKTDQAASSGSNTSNGLLRNSRSSRKAGDISNRELRARFLRTSARYLGVNIENRELESRYVSY